MKRIGAGLCLAVGLLVSQPVLADVYQTPEDFVREAQATPEAAQSLWLTGEVKNSIRSILGRDYQSLRLKYWRNGAKSIWVLDDIGKDEYITLGFVIQNQQIEQSKVLVFRESRGWEIKFPSFAQQFLGARLTDKLQLDRKVDGITGATLSVNAYERLARLALLLDRAAHEQR